MVGQMVFLVPSPVYLPTVGRRADGTLGDTPGEFKVEHRRIFVKSWETLQNLF
jgi:hypothetical protein